MNRDLVYQLGCSAALRRPQGDYSVETVNDAFRGEIAEYTKDYNTFRRHKIELFELVQDIVDTVLPINIRNRFDQWIEIKTVPHNTKVTFTKKVGRARAKSFITKVGLGGVFETFRLDNETFEVPVTAMGGAAVIDFERFLAGDESFADCIDVLMEGLSDKIYDMVISALQADYNNSARPAANKATASGFTAASFDPLLNVVSAYGAPMIICTNTFAQTIPGNYIAANSTTRISEADASDVRNFGYVKVYKGAPVIVIPNSYTDETNTVKVLDDGFAFIVPATSGKLVKVVLEGGSIVDEFVNKNRSREISVYQKMGCAIVHSNDNAIYENSAL